MVKPIRKGPNKSPPIFSQEFFIQNHSDIISGIAMAFVIGLMIQATSPISSLFVTLQHNITEADYYPLYESGASDWATIFFYSLICIIVRSIIQEHILDKISKKLHLSKSKLSVFNTSGRLSVFYIIYTLWGLEITVLREHYIPDINLLWSDYPAPMPYLLKLYLIVQLGYCLHELPEIYFQRTKREEYLNKIIKSLAVFTLVTIPYFLNFNRLLMCLLVLHYISELIYHIGELIQTVDKDERFTKVTRLISSVVLILARLASIVLAVVTLWYGLALGEQHELNIQTGYFNTPLIRLTVLAGILIVQLYHTFNFISHEVARVRESKLAVASQRTKPQRKDKLKKNKRFISEESDLPEVDQNTNKNLRGRTQKTK